MPSDESVSLAAPATVGASILRKVVTGGAIGNAVEWFDFAIVWLPGHLHRRELLPVGQRDQNPDYDDGALLFEPPLVGTGFQDNVRGR